MGKPAAAATDLLDAPDSECVKEFFGSATIVLGDNGEVPNSKCLERSFLQLLRLSCTVRRIWMTSGEKSLQRVSTAFGVFHDSLIRDRRPNSLHHPIHACAHSRLDGCGVGSGVGSGAGAGAVVSCVVSSGVVDDVDDTCMDGSALDVIRPGSNSVIQSFSEYHVIVHVLV